MRSCLTLIVVLVVAAVLGLGYLGFIPGVASVFGSDKPRDLGVRPTPADLQSANTKTGVKLASLPKDAPAQESLKYSGQKALNNSFTDEEITALINNSTWKYNPVKDVQVKINADGTAEASGLLRVDRFQGYAAATGVASDVVNTVMDRLKIAPNSSPPFYVKGTGSVDNGKVTLNPQQLEIGRFSVPANWITDNKTAAVGHIEDRLKRIQGMSVKSFSFSNGTAKFDGTVPDTEATSPE